MNRKMFLLLAAIFAADVLFLFSCAKVPEGEKEDFSYLYCLNSDRTGLWKVKYKIEEGSPLKEAKKMLAKLKEVPDQIEYTQAIPEGISVDAMELEGQVLKLDFGGRYRDIPELEEKLVRAAIVQSLAKIKGINGVLITVEGEELLDSDGKRVGILTPDDFVKNTGDSMSSYRSGRLLLYFSNESRDKLIPVEEDVTYNSNTAMEKLIVEKLAKGPTQKGTYPTLDSKVNIFGVTIKDGICYVNFDASFLTGQVDVRPEVTVYSIVNSLVEGTNASKVQITVNGKKDVTYRDSVDFTNPLQRDMDWVEKEK